MQPRITTLCKEDTSLRNQSTVQSTSLIRVKLGDCGQNTRMASRTSRKQEERINLVTTTIIMRKSRYVNKIWHPLMTSMEKTAII